MDTEPILEKNEIYPKEEFIKKFNNFHLIFTQPDPEYLSDIKEFLHLSRHADKFKEIKERFEKKEERKESRQKIIEEYMSDFYEMYMALRKDNKFSNKQLGLIYW